MTGYWVAVGGALLTITAVLELLRRRRLREKYAVLWLCVSAGVVLLALFPGLLEQVSELTNVKTPLNLLFFVSALLLLIVSIQFSGELSTLEEKTRTLAEEIGILEMRLDAAEAELRERPGPPADHSG